MANTKEIQNRINSIQDTMKITKAMYMMSSMKLRKARQKLADTEPFFQAVQQSLADIIAHFPDMQHIYFDNRAKDEQERIKKKGYIVVSGDKGMAGAYNHNAILDAMELIGTDMENSYVYSVGEVGRAFLFGQGYQVAEDFRYSANNPSMHRARVITEYVLDKYNREEIDELYIVYTKMVNSITEEVYHERLLPLKTNSYLKVKFKEAQADHDRGFEPEEKDKALSNYEIEAMENGDSWYRFSPSVHRVLESLVNNFITGFVYGALVECSASEENARMLAMQSATDNAEAMLHDLSIEYNRVRQAAITQEITEVIGGAKALKKKKNKV